MAKPRHNLSTRKTHHWNLHTKHIKSTLNLGCYNVLWLQCRQIMFHISIHYVVHLSRNTTISPLDRSYSGKSRLDCSFFLRLLEYAFRHQWNRYSVIINHLVMTSSKFLTKVLQLHHSDLFFMQSLSNY